MSFGAQMESAFQSIFGGPAEPKPDPDTTLPESYSPSTEPLFSDDDPAVVEVRTLSPGDCFLAQFSGEYQLMHHDGMHAYALHLTTGVEQILGNRARVLPKQGRSE